MLYVQLLLIVCFKRLFYNCWQGLHQSQLNAVGAAEKQDEQFLKGINQGASSIAAQNQNALDKQFGGNFLDPFGGFGAGFGGGFGNGFGNTFGGGFGVSSFGTSSGFGSLFKKRR